jgi:hypothetical protein
MDVAVDISMSSVEALFPYAHSLDTFHQKSRDKIKPSRLNSEEFKHGSHHALER